MLPETFLPTVLSCGILPPGSGMLASREFAGRVGPVPPGTDRIRTCIPWSIRWRISY